MANELKVGSVVALLADVDAFKEAFARVDSAGDEMCCWTSEKQQHRGNRGTVVEIYDDALFLLYSQTENSLNFPSKRSGLAMARSKLTLTGMISQQRCRSPVTNTLSFPCASIRSMKKGSKLTLLNFFWRSCSRSGCFSN